MGATLYERLGGRGAITAVVDAVVARVAADERINAKFAKTDIPTLKRLMVEQIGEAAGGPERYSGRNMRETHDGMGVTAGEFDALVEDLVATLDQFRVGKAEQDELLGVLGPMRPEIVEIESSRTGTPLPESYAPRPPVIA
jgi:hemoglobin